MIPIGPGAFGLVVCCLSSQHVDGAGKVDGSVVVALPIDRWSAPYPTLAFEGGGLTFWDGKHSQPEGLHYDTRSGDVAFIDRYVCNSKTNNTGNDLGAFLFQQLLVSYFYPLPSFSGRFGTKQIRLPKELGGLWSFFTKLLDPDIAVE